VFPFQHQLMTNVLPNIVEKVENIYSTLTCFMHYLHNVFWYLDVLWWTSPLPWLSNLLPIYESPHATMGILGANNPMVWCHYYKYVFLQLLLWLKFQWKQTNWTKLSIVRLNKSIMPKKLTIFLLSKMTKMIKTTSWHDYLKWLRWLKLLIDMNINIFLNINFYLNFPNWTMDNLWLYCWKINKIWVWWMGFVIWCHGYNMSKLRFESSLPRPQSKVFTTQPPHHVVI
jgi:hypothetical protein